MPRLSTLAAWLLCAASAGAWTPAAASPLPADWLPRVEQLAEQAARSALPADARVAIEVGQLDPRLRLAPCAQIQPFLPQGQSFWGRSRIGLRCTAGAVRWSVSVPVQVRVFAPTWVARGPLTAGVLLQSDHFERAVAEVSADSAPLLSEPPAGRVLARNMQAGEVMRQPHLKSRQWFAAGDTVKVNWQGQGFAVSAEGQAMGVGLEGQSVRVRLSTGRIIQGVAVAERVVEAAS